MVCPKCTQEVVADKFFCTWCEANIPNFQIGTKAGVFRRWFAMVKDQSNKW